ncbi:MFS transporter [Pedomonas mirosovicensis]|uniref:MFS transporter n=1 Tax=Pedomonas mirosovicensis TaxID=2908641 RepID=UPI002167379E|nr:MFS transporter [Pedomonas mirosovicensis]MCH8686739.1 MFS transporter [Pedomonas mirosovicensis]
MTEGQAPDTAARQSPFSPFRHPVFRAIWIASLISNFGSLIQSVGASWMMTSIAGSADMVALVQASTTLPIMLFSLAAGAIADNFDRRVVMIAAQGLMLAVSIALTAITFLGLMTPWLLLSLTFLVGCGTALNGPAWQASVGEQVPREDLPGAVALNSISFNIARSVGPAIGGALVAAAGAAAAFLANALSYVGLITVLVGWRRNPPPRQLPREPLASAMMAGIRYAVMAPAISRVLLRGLSFGVAGSAVWALMALIARERLHGGPLTYGLILGAFGIGAVLGAFVSTHLRRRLRNETLVRWAMAGYGIGTAIAGVSTVLPLTMAGLLLAGAGWVLALSTFNVSVQMSSPRWVVARALAVYQTVTFGGMAIGSWLWGHFAEQVGLADAMVASGIAVLASAALGLWRRLPQMETLDLTPVYRDALPTPKVELDLRSGPVVLQIEYRVDPGDAMAFLAVMDERRRIRQRNGARGWSLMQDLTQPELWIERYHSATWGEHLHQRARITVADREVDRRVLAFHRGEEPPRIHRLLERPPGALPAGSRQAPRDLSRGAVVDPTLPPQSPPVAKPEQ